MIPATTTVATLNGPMHRPAGAWIRTVAAKTRRLRATAQAIPPAKNGGRLPEGAPIPPPETAPLPRHRPDATHRMSAEAVARRLVPGVRMPAEIRRREPKASEPNIPGSSRPWTETPARTPAERRAPRMPKAAGTARIRPGDPKIAWTGSIPPAPPSRAHPTAAAAMPKNPHGALHPNVVSANPERRNPTPWQTPQEGTATRKAPVPAPPR